MYRVIIPFAALLFLGGCMSGGDTVKNLQGLYGEAMDIKDQQTMKSTQASDLRNQLNLFIAELGKMIGLSPQTLFKDGTGQHAFQISQNIATAATIVVGSTSALSVNNDMMNSMKTRILGITANLPTNYTLNNTWNMLQYDLIGEFISMQASYLSLVPQYISQIMVYLNKTDIQALANKIKLATEKLKEGI